MCAAAFVEGGAIIGDRVTIKNQVLTFEGVTVEHDVLGPAVVVTNDLRPRAQIKRGGDALLPTAVREGATLGSGVVVGCGTTVGANAFVGAGAVVAKDGPTHAFIVGNPGRRIGSARTCRERLSDNLSCRDCGRRFEYDARDGALGGLMEIEPATEPIGYRSTSTLAG